MKTSRLLPALLVAASSAGLVEAGQYKLLVVEPDDPYPLAISGVSDVSDLGLVVGRTSIAGQGVRFEWTAEHGFRFPTHLPASGNRRVNNFGDSIIQGTPSVFLADGTEILLPPPPNSEPGSTGDLNDALTVVGHAVSTGSSSSIFTWNPTDGTEVILIDSARELRRVNSGTTAVGNFTINGTDTYGFVVDLQTHSHVDFRDILPGTGGSEAFDVNDSGHVLGFGPDGTSLSAFVWHPSTGLTFLPGLEGGPTLHVRPRAIDDAGRVVGSARTGANSNRAFLWDSQHGMMDLNDLVDDAGDFLMVEAIDLSETGVIVGRGFHGTSWGPDRAFILVPRVPAGPPAATRR